MENNNLIHTFRSQPLRQANGKFYFRQVPFGEERSDSVDRLKGVAKRWPRLYRRMVSVLSPVCTNRSPLKRFLAGEKGLVLNLGSGNHRVAPHVVNVDMFDYDHVDIVADIHDLPFKDGTVDGIMSVAVLEHVADPEAVVREMYRVLKPGGKVYNLIPFMQPFHASPHDYQRYTLPGIRRLHRDFVEIQAGVGGGPTSGLLWVLQEWIATMLSFGCVPLRNGLYLATMLLTWPLKYLDLVFCRFPTATNIASSFYFYGEKRYTGGGSG